MIYALVRVKNVNVLEFSARGTRVGFFFRQRWFAHTFASIYLARSYIHAVSYGII